MGQCICVTCKNLKALFNEDGEPGEYNCKYGFPAQTCEMECLDENCNLSCSNFSSEEDEDVFTIVNCSKCGKALNQTSSDDASGKTFCVDCFLSKD